MVDVENSILNDTKEILGLPADYKVYDLTVKTHINSVFLDLQQLAIGPDAGFMITDENDTWQSFLPLETDKVILNAAKTYLYLKVRTLFDPPTTQNLVQMMAEQIKQLEYRLNLAVEARIGPTA